MSREKPDFYALKAKKEGYPARSVYKLQELDEKFQLISRKEKVLDLGCSPGSWSLYVLKKLSPKGELLGVDLKEVDIKAHPRAKFLTGDMFSPSVLHELEKAGPFDLVMSDAAPNTTGNRTVDAGRSFSLCSGIIDLASRILAPQGDLVIKVFQGGDEKELKEAMGALFSQVKVLKPKAVRKDSFETYLVGKNRKKDDL